MNCSESINSTSHASQKGFSNWARSIKFSANDAYRPSSRGEIVEIIAKAERENKRIKWVGSRWSFTESFVSNDYIIETDLISGEIDSLVILNQLPLNTIVTNLVHVKGGTKVYNINRILHGFTPSPDGSELDEEDLDCGLPGFRNKALPTLGGSGGQSIAGLLATGSHGGDIHLPSMADFVQAIHLIGPGGQEWWIERNTGALTIGDETTIQNMLRNIAVNGNTDELCEHIIVKKNDDFFNSVLVSVGRMGFVYSLVMKTVDAFKLSERRQAGIWENIKTELTASRFNSYVSGRNAVLGAPLHFLNVLILPYRKNGFHECRVVERHVVPCNTPNVGMDDQPRFDVFTYFCTKQNARNLTGVLLAAIGLLIVLGIGIVSIPLFGWILAIPVFALVATLTSIVVYLTVSRQMTTGQLIARISNSIYSIGILKPAMRDFLIGLFNNAYPIKPSLGASWKIMDTYSYEQEDFCQKVDSMEFAFDLAQSEIDNAKVHSGYLGFIKEVLDAAQDLYNRNKAIAGLIALRFTKKTKAKLGMSKFPITCHVEIPLLREFSANAEFLQRIQQSAIKFNGVPHWGQVMHGYNKKDIENVHGLNDMIMWRRTLTSLIGGGNETAFSNVFTSTYNLEPWDESVIQKMKVTIAVGDDSLGDTDILRQNVSADYLFVTIKGGGRTEISLNQGQT